ncbi:MAG: hypothetical protein HKN33_12695 [Pyrinomonadaceae bacterium]|nr:hypothetical protein [Pyrinomonadaceae bacterium]
MENAENTFNLRESGAALITSILALLLATLLGIALVSVGLSSFEISNNGLQQTEAFYIADSGITHASALINRVKKGDYSVLLTTGDGIPNTGDELSAPPVTGLWPASESILAGNNAGGGILIGTGRYFVSVRNDTAPGETATADINGILIVTSTGIGRDGATATVEAVVKSVALELPGLLSNGDARFSNDLTVLGPYGLIQINGDLSVPGTGQTTCAEQRFEIMGNPTVYSNINVTPSCNTAPVVGTTLLFNQPRAVPPIIDIAELRSEYQPRADWIFKDNGSIYPQTNGVERGTPLSMFEKTTIGLDGWTYNNSLKKWSHLANKRLPDGNYYFLETNARLTKGGNIANPPRVTIFAEGHISLNNQISLQPYEPGFALISGNDISMSSKYSNLNNPGLFYAYGQIRFSNTTYVVGGMIAADFYRENGTFGPDANDPGGTNLVGRMQGAMQVSGDTTIMSSNFGTVIGSTVVSWREVRY